MHKVTIQSVLLGVAVALITIYVTLKVLSNSPTESPADSHGKITTASLPAEEDHPILGKSKLDISKLYPGNCFAELYLKNPSFGGKLINSCKQKTIDQIKAVTGKNINTSELTSTEVLNHLKTTYGANNPWRL